MKKIFAIISLILFLAAGCYSPNQVQDSENKYTEEELMVKAYLVKKYNFGAGMNGMPIGLTEDMMRAEAELNAKLVNENPDLSDYIRNNFKINDTTALAYKILQFGRIELEKTTTGYNFEFRETISCLKTKYRGKIFVNNQQISDELESKEKESVPC